jgi:type VII secretion protein EccB
MQTQRDHVHAHQFLMNRMSNALVFGDPTSPEPPGRRTVTGLLLGTLIFVLIGAGFGVYGWIVPGGSKAYRQAGAILVEKESGARYVFLGGVLHPTPNLASAMLIQGPRAKVTLISRSSLRGIPRGSVLGIVGAPQIMPSPKDLVAGPWLACLPAPGAAGSAVMSLNLDPDVPAQAVPDDRFLLVQAPGKEVYLVARGFKHRVRGKAVLVPLGASDLQPLDAPAAWLAQLPDGMPLKPAVIGRAGADGPRVNDRVRRVGTLFRLRLASGDEQHFVLRSDGLAPLSRTEFALLEATTDTAPVDLDTAAAVDAPRSADRSLLTRLPDLVAARPLAGSDQAVCLQQRPATLATLSTAVVLVERRHVGVDESAGAGVRARPASGMLIVPVPFAEQSQGLPVHFLSDEGVAFPVPDSEALQALGLSGVPLVPFPKDLFTAFSRGPALTRQAITQPEGR